MPPERATILLALLSADGFLSCARPFVQKVSGMTIDEAPRYAGAHLGELVVAATTLGLSIELYLKALWMLVGKSPPHGHHLLAFYKHLPQDLKASIDAQYQKLSAQPERFAVAVAVDVPPITLKEQKPLPTKITDRSLRAVLLRSSEVFVAWRYFHEVPKADRPSSISFEFFHLNAIADILKTHVAQALGGSVATTAPQPPAASS